VSRLPVRWRVAGQAALGPGEQGDPVVVGEGALAQGLRGRAAVMQDGPPVVLGTVTLTQPFPERP